MEFITVNVALEDGSVAEYQAPTDMGLSLMEFLKANEHDILATCGGIALCATCHVEVLEGFDKLNEIGDEEYAILDTLPTITTNSRLSCQLRLDDNLHNIKVKILGDGL